MFLNATVHTPVGVFKGSVNDPNQEQSSEELVKLRDFIQKNPMNNLTIFGEKGKEISFAGEVLKNSVIEYTINDYQVTR